MCFPQQVDSLLVSNKSVKTLDCLAGFTGQESSYDLKLALCLDQVENDYRNWKLLPYALAATFYAESWNGTKYIIEHDAYSGNEHLAFKVRLPCLIPYLLGCHHDGLSNIPPISLSPSVDQQTLGDILLCLKAKSKVEAPADRMDVRELGRGFLAASSAVLLQLKTSDPQPNQQHNQRDLHVLFTSLDKVSDWMFPSLDLSHR